MRKEIIISEVNDLAVVFEDGRAVEFFLRHGDQLVGDIIWGQVEAVVPGIEAAFVNIGQERNGFIHVADLPSAQTPRRQAAPKKPSIRVKEKILVQIAKAPTGNKGARLTGRLTIPGRFLVLVPHDNRVSISRRITEAHERDRLRRLTLKLKDPGHGVIVRTEAIGRSEDDLRQDIEELIDIWADILHQVQIVNPPSLLHRDSDLIHRVLRDAMSSDVTKVVVDTANGYQKARDILKGWAPELARHVVQHRGPQSVLSRYRISEELEAAISPKVWLPSGGYLVIEHTEALTVIDVNSGRLTQSRSLADTVLRTNMEAAAEVARQLRLRDIGGIVVIDFISMDTESDRKKVLNAFHEALRQDKSRPQVTGFSEHGLIEVSRRRQGQNLLEQLTSPCEECGGTGRIRHSHLLPQAGQAGRLLEETSAIVHEITEEPLADEVVLPETAGMNGYEEEELELGAEAEGEGEGEGEGEAGRRRRRRRRRGRGRGGETPMGYNVTATPPEGLTPEEEDEEGFLPPVLVPEEPVLRHGRGREAAASFGREGREPREGRGRRVGGRREEAAPAEAPLFAEGPLVEEVALDLFGGAPAPREREAGREREGGRERGRGGRGREGREERRPREEFRREEPRREEFRREEPRREEFRREEPRREAAVGGEAPAGRTRRVDRRGPAAEAAPAPSVPVARISEPVAPKREAAPAAAPAMKAAPKAAPKPVVPAQPAPIRAFEPAAPAKPLPLPEEVIPDAVPGLFVLKKKEAPKPVEVPVEAEEEEEKKPAAKRRTATARRATKAKPEAEKPAEAEVKPAAKAKTAAKPAATKAAAAKPAAAKPAAKAAPAKKATAAKAEAPAKAEKPAAKAAAKPKATTAKKATATKAKKSEG